MGISHSSKRRRRFRGAHAPQVALMARYAADPGNLTPEKLLLKLFRATSWTPSKL